MVVGAMRSPEPELYKDKIEISLDGRQVFYLFFGGAVVACLVFVLGVMVGRRVEARSHVDHAAATSAARDPLAALDQLDQSAGGADDLSFRTKLGGGAGKGGGEVDQAAVAIEKTKAAAAAKPAVVAKAPAAAAGDDDEKPVKAPEAKKKSEKDERKPEKKEEEKEKGKGKGKGRGKEIEDAAKKADAQTKADADAIAKAADTPEDTHFTLQLSSFQDKTQAESFLADIKAAGFKGYVVAADVDGKGTWYRVRYGHYDSYQAALDAKADFERKVNKIAYVTRL